jgi:intraflagellar transport protein 88
MGNIYFEQGKYPAAIKMYRMALDALPAAAAGPRARLMTNIGLAFVQLGQYGDAAAAFENALDTAADHQVGETVACCRDHMRSSCMVSTLGHIHCLLVHSSSLPIATV